MPLDLLFKGKFERVPDETLPSKPEIVRVVNVTKPIEPVEPKKPLLPHPNDPEPVLEGETKEESKDSESQQEEAEKKPKPRSKYGKDVTEDFSEAVLLNLTIYYSERKGVYSVVDSEDGEETVIKTSKSKKNVEKFLEKGLE